MIGLPQLKARIERLERLSDGLAAELTALAARREPLLTAEEQERYRLGLSAAYGGVEAARRPLVEALERASARGRGYTQ